MTKYFGEISTYTAPANGWFSVDVTWGNPSSWISLANNSVIGYIQTGSMGATDGITYVPARKGDAIIISYYLVTPVWLRFTYTEGSEND